MMTRYYWNLAGGCLAAATAAGIVATLTMLEVGRLLDAEVDRSVRNIREIIVPIVDRLPDDRPFEDLQLILATPDIKGIEVFDAQGRRIWHAGESLEIVGYRFGKQSALSHSATDGTRYEVFWSAHALQAKQGVALRVDTRWQDPILRQLTGRAILTSIIPFVFGIVVAVIVLKRNNMYTTPIQ